jgi:hypothetical protein
MDLILINDIRAQTNQILKTFKLDREIYLEELDLPSEEKINLEELIIAPEFALQVSYLAGKYGKILRG